MALAEQANPAFAAEGSVRGKAVVSSASSVRHVTMVLFVAADLVAIWLGSLAALGLRFTPAFPRRLGLSLLDRGAHLTAHAGYLLLYSVLVVLLCNAEDRKSVV